MSSNRTSSPNSSIILSYILGIRTVSEVLEIKESITYQKVEIWLDRIIGGDVLLPLSSKIYFELRPWGAGKWKLIFFFFCRSIISDKYHYEFGEYDRT